MTSTSDEKWRAFNFIFQSGWAKELSVLLYMQMISYFPLLKSKLSGMSMWIWLCRHRKYNSPQHAPFSRKTLYNLLYHSECFQKTLNSTRWFILSFSMRKHGINKLTNLYVCIYINIDKPFRGNIVQRLLCVGGLTAISITSWWSLAFSYSHSLLNFVVVFLSSVCISSCNSKPLPVRKLFWSHIAESNSSNKLLYHWRVLTFYFFCSQYELQCSDTDRQQGTVFWDLTFSTQFVLSCCNCLRIWHQRHDWWMYSGVNSNCTIWSLFGGWKKCVGVKVSQWPAHHVKKRTCDTGVAKIMKWRQTSQLR